jgi:hypothetical protein
MSIKAQYSAKQIRIEQQLLQEIEFEWIRQYWIQGQKYQVIHEWWNEPMRQLLQSWIQLNKKTLDLIHILQAASGLSINP